MSSQRDAKFREAQHFADKGQYSEALVRYESMLSGAPDEPRIYLKLGDLLSRMGEYERAVGIYENAGKIYSRHGSIEKALAVYKQIRELIKKFVPHMHAQYMYATHELAEMYMRLGLKMEAASTLDQFASSLLASQRIGDAIAVLRRLAVLIPENPIPRLKLGEVFSKQGESESASAEMVSAGHILIKSNRYADAARVFERAVALSPQPQAVKELARLYLEHGSEKAKRQDAMKAIRKLQIAIQHDANDLEALELLAMAFSNLSQSEKVKAVYQEMVRIAIESGDLSIQRKLNRKLTDWDAPSSVTRSLAEALNSLEPMGQLHQVKTVVKNELPSQFTANETLDDELTLAGRPLVGLQASVKLAENDKQTVDYLLRQAQAFREQGDRVRALETLDEAYLLNPKESAILVLYKDIARESGYKQEAKHALLRLAAFYIEGLENDYAAGTLWEILEFLPDDLDAERALAELGINVHDRDSKSTIPLPHAHIEKVLDDVDGLILAGNLREAKKLIDQSLVKYPRHKLLLEKKDELDHSYVSPRSSILDYIPAEPSVLEDSADTSFSILEQLGRGEQSGVLLNADTRTMKLNDMNEDDSLKSSIRTHYDLGIAYQEMGRIEDAISAFEVASQDPSLECICFAMIGKLEKERNEKGKALTAFLRALSSKQKSKAQEVEVAYDVAVLFEALGRSKEAQLYYRHIQKLSPSYKDSGKRLARLRRERSM